MKTGMDYSFTRSFFTEPNERDLSTVGHDTTILGTFWPVQESYRGNLKKKCINEIVYGNIKKNILSLPR